MSENTDQNGFNPIESSDWPTVGQPVSYDFYIRLPYANRFIRYICKQDIWDEHKESALKNHVDPQLYRSIGDLIGDSIIRPDDLAKIEPEETPNDPSFSANINAPQELRVFKNEVDKELKSIFKFLSNPQATDEVQTLKTMEHVTEKILQTVAPDIEDLRGAILGNSKYLMVMADAAALTSIAVLIAMSHGFDSRRIFRDLSTAIMLMDLPLGELPKETVQNYYLNPSGLSEAELLTLKSHPQKSYDVASKKLKNLPEPVLQLMLNHHEYYNGSGYPKGIRNEQLPSIVRSLSLSVSVFEIMKREDLKGNEFSIVQALEELKELHEEAHRRKHNQRLVNQSIDYIRPQTV